MDELEGKLSSESKIEDYFYEVYPNDLNSNGTAFGGRIMEIADKLAASLAKHHTERVCTTVSVDSLWFRAPTKRGEILIFKASINRVWGSSLEIGLKVMAEDSLNKDVRHVVSAFFTLVALDNHNQSVKIPPIIPESDEDKRRYVDAEQRREHRLEKKRAKEKRQS